MLESEEMEPRNCQKDRYDFLCSRDGQDRAQAFMRDVRKTYRKAVLDKTKYTMYRRQLICGYICAGKLS